MVLFLFHLSDVFLWFVWVVFFVAAKGHDPQVCSCLGLTLPDHYQIGCAGGGGGGDGCVLVGEM